MSINAIIFMLSTSAREFELDLRAAWYSHTFPFKLQVLSESSLRAFVPIK
jgi:hypothetical protein